MLRYIRPTFDLAAVGSLSLRPLVRHLLCIHLLFAYFSVKPFGSEQTQRANILCSPPQPLLQSIDRYELWSVTQRHTCQFVKPSNIDGKDRSGERPRIGYYIVTGSWVVCIVRVTHLGLKYVGQIRFVPPCERNCS